MRAVTLALCLTLAGCLTTDEPAPAAPPAQPTAAAPPDTPPPAQRRGAPAATRGAAAPYVPPPQASEPPTDPILAIRQTCWSQGNANTSFKSLEARADWVNKCIGDRMKTLQ